jgi:hypothetical protein
MSDYRRGFGLDIEFIYHFNTTLNHNYSAIVNLHTLQITRAHVKSFTFRSVFTSSCLVTALIMAISLLPFWSPLWTAAPFQLLILFYWPTRKHSFPEYLYCCLGNVFTEPLPRNDSTRYNIYLWCVWPLLDNGSVNKSPELALSTRRTSIAR